MDLWFHRIVPEGYALATFTLEGRSPYLMNSTEYDLDGELYRAYFALGQKAKKSLDDGRRLREMEWKLGLHLDENIGPFVKGATVRKLLSQSATHWRKGAEVIRSLAVLDYRIPLLYDGPRDEDGLRKGRFYYDTMVTNSGRNKGRVWRRRPMFKVWSLVAEIAYDPADLDFDVLQMVAARSRKFGIGDGRSIGFGQFVHSFTPGAVTTGETNGSALKKADVVDVAAHAAARERILAKV